MTRWKAAGIHLLISAIVIGGVAALLLWRWYPPALWGVAKADKLMMILALVDVMLGPVLTLVVYKAGKKSLRFDLTVIALLQLTALAYGLNTVWQSRPVYLVAAVDRFQMVFANEIDRADLAKASPPFRSLPLTGLQIIGAKVPEGAEARNEVLFSAMSGKDIHLLPAYYAPYEEVASQLAQRAILADALADTLTADEAQRLRRAVVATGRQPSSVAVAPVSSIRSASSAAMLVDAATGSILGPAAVDVWSGQASKGGEGHGASFRAQARISGRPMPAARAP